jgi:hypothetical protein
MTAMVTTLTEFSDSGNSRVYTSPAHTAVKAAKVLQRRRVPNGSQVILEDEISVVHGTEDAAGDPLDQNVVISVKVRRPKNGITADVDAALVIALDIVQSTEFDNTVTTQEYLF